MRRATIIAAAVGLLAAALAGPPPGVAAPQATGGPPAAGHLPHFDLLDRPIALGQIPLTLRFPFEDGLPKGARHGFQTGTVKLAEGTVTAFGNRRMMCFEAKVGEFAGGSCEHMHRILRRGLSVVSPCVDESEDARVAGIVPNGITALGVDRKADGKIEGEIPVTDNAFIALLEPVGVVLHAIGPGAHGLAIKYPLGRLGKQGRPCGGEDGGGVSTADAPRSAR